MLKVAVTGIDVSLNRETKSLSSVKFYRFNQDALKHTGNNLKNVIFKYIAGLQVYSKLGK